MVLLHPAVAGGHLQRAASLQLLNFALECQYLLRIPVSGEEAEIRGRLAQLWHQSLFLLKIIMEGLRDTVRRLD